ncbi:MAG: hypothetical protein KJ070_25080 [Verrucomicrobia bacterium]|nr:hypothetical protein [Verrucomicrobiota bacterium]
MKHLTSFYAVTALVLTAIPGKSAVVYSPGPLPPPPPFIIGAPQPVDFDGDGVSEVEFTTGLTLCTMDVPTSFCTTPYFIGAASTNQLLVNDFLYSAVLPLGGWIGDVPPTNTLWSTPGFRGYLTASWWSLYGQEINGQRVFSGWTGPLGAAGRGFVGVRFYAADGAHYGWIRVGLGFPTLVLDWAYESEPDTPIIAGAGIDHDHDSVWDLVDECPNTPAGEAVNADGCSIGQLVPCDGPWRSHGEYVARVARVIIEFRRQGLISGADARAILRVAARSDCGKTPRRPGHDSQVSGHRNPIR